MLAVTPARVMRCASSSMPQSIAPIRPREQIGARAYGSSPSGRARRFDWRSSAGAGKAGCDQDGCDVLGLNHGAFADRWRITAGWYPRVLHDDCCRNETRRDLSYREDREVHFSAKPSRWRSQGIFGFRDLSRDLQLPHRPPSANLESMKFLARLATGDIALWCTFWLIGTPLAIVWDVSGGCKIAGCGIEDPFIAVFLLVLFTLSSVAIAFASVAIWRSSSRYPREVWWQGLHSAPNYVQRCRDLRRP